MAIDEKFLKPYNPAETEEKIYKLWEESGFFNPDICVQKGVTGPDAPAYSIVLPPPNVTGTLHMGHAAMLAIEDIMIRFERMRGKRTLWIPGTDHAAIATQSKVETEMVKKEGKNRHDLGREEFLKRVEKFARESHDTIVNQLRKMGSSLDWSREAFTLDDKRKLAVNAAFKRMYDEGLIYRGTRIVNWCPRCASTLSDDEVEYKEQKAILYTFRYSKDFPIAISTTRPETKLGDTAVAVNPSDERYKRYIGKSFDVDWGHGPQTIKIVSDEGADPSFGTGALGVTPAHSHADYEIARKNFLPILKVIDERGKMTDASGKVYAGLSVKKAREKLVEWLKENGLMEKEEEIPQNLSICYRCGAAIEPLPSLQWFIDVNKKISLPGNRFFQNKSIKEAAVWAVRGGEIKIIPERFEKTYFQWVENLRDWCISRQIWYGHRIPVWHKLVKKGIKIKLVRLGDVKSENLKRVQTYKDILETPLSDTGREQIRSLSSALKSGVFEAILTSEQVAAAESADIISKEIKSAVKVDERLNGINVGEEQVVSEHLIRDHYGLDIRQLIDSHWNVPFRNGESYADVVERTRKFLLDVIGEYDGKNIIIVCSGSSFAAVRYLTEGIWPTELIPFGAQTDVNLKDMAVPAVDDPRGDLKQDGDTLDTWFSSGLWTFSTLGWPHYAQSATRGEPGPENDFANYHPTNVLETGYDILFFWVARMILMSTFLLGDVPFRDVYLHGLVRDERGRKMSKSLGNIIDPLNMIEKYGADATRMSLIIGTGPGNDSKLSEEKIKAYKHFSNKIWNASRFVMENTEGISLDDKPELSDEDAKRIGELGALSDEITGDIENYRFYLAGEKLYHYFWHTFADVIIEESKTRLKEGSEADKKSAGWILRKILSDSLKMLHPFMPFITEEVWSSLSGRSGDKGLLMVSLWPHYAHPTPKATGRHGKASRGEPKQKS